MTGIGRGPFQVGIEKGELRSYRYGGYEFMHQVGSPGWGNSDTEMFPVIGPTAEADYRVQVPRGNAVQDQHGLLRELEYQLQGKTAESAIFYKTYKAGTLVKNSKYPQRSKVQWLMWPYDFRIEKAFGLSDSGLEISFAVSGEKDMPFMFGYHPAFKLRTAEPYISAGERIITLDDVLAAGNKALLVQDRQEVCLHDEKSLMVKTSGFRHFMLWTEVPNMVCIEPITFYPYATGQHQLHTGFEYLGPGEHNFRVQLQPAP